MKKLLLALLLAGSCYADGISSRLNITEEDGSPTTYPWQARFSNGTVTDNGDGTVSITSGGGGGSSLLGVNYNGVSITSPTAQINFVGSGVSVAASGSTATVTIAGGGSSVLASSGVAFGSPTNTMTSDTNTFTWDSTAKTLSVIGNISAGSSATGFGNTPRIVFNTLAVGTDPQLNLYNNNFIGSGASINFFDWAGTNYGQISANPVGGAMTVTTARGFASTFNTTSGSSTVNNITSLPVQADASHDLYGGLIASSGVVTNAFINNQSTLQSGTTAYPSFAHVGSKLLPQGEGSAFYSAFQADNLVTNSGGGITTASYITSFASPTASSSYIYYGGVSQAFFRNNVNSSGARLVGALNYAEARSTSTIGTLYGGQNQASNVGGGGVLLNVGQYAEADTNFLSSSSTFQSAILTRTFSTNGSTVTSNYGIYVSSPIKSDDSIITNDYGIYIDSRNPGGYGIVSINGKNYFGDTITERFGVIASSFAVTGLPNQSCLGTDSSGNIQAGTCSGGGGGSSSLETLFGTARSSPTATLKGSSDFLGSVSGSTMTISMNPLNSAITTFSSSVTFTNTAGINSTNITASSMTISSITFSGQLTFKDGTVLSSTNSLNTAAPGSNTNLIYNNGGFLAGTDQITYDTTTLRMGVNYVTPAERLSVGGKILAAAVKAPGTSAYPAMVVGDTTTVNVAPFSGHAGEMIAYIVNADVLEAQSALYVVRDAQFNGAPSALNSPSLGFTYLYNSTGAGGLQISNNGNPYTFVPTQIGSHTWTGSNGFPRGISASTLTLTGLPSLSCLGTDGSGNVQSGTCSGGSGGGASTLETLFGTARSSPTATLKGQAGQFTGSVSGSTMTITLDASSVTLQGNTFNGASQLVQLNGSTQLPAVSGALLTNIATTKPPLAFNLDGGGVVISSASATLRRWAVLPYAVTISSWNISCDANTATISVSVSTTSWSSFKTNGPTSAGSICASACPSLASGAYGDTRGLTGWVTSLNASDVVVWDITGSAPTVATVCKTDIWVN